MIAYSAEAEPARAFLLKAYNDIDVFVEDTGCQNMYIRLINRMLDGRARVSQVYPLGSRYNVVKQCRADQLGQARRRLYIIDADMDLLLGRPAPRLKHLYRLRVYCAENLLLAEAAFITLGTESRTNSPWPVMAEELALRPLLDRAVKTLLPLFVLYGVVQKLGLEIQTVKYAVHQLLVDPSDPSTLSDRLVRARLFSLIRQIRKRVSACKYRTARDAILRRIAKNRRDRSAYISGKHYLLPLAYLQLKRISGLRDSQNGVKVRLAQHCDLSIDRGLRRALLAAARDKRAT